MQHFFPIISLKATLLNQIMKLFICNIRITFFADLKNTMSFNTFSPPIHKELCSNGIRQHEFHGTRRKTGRNFALCVALYFSYAHKLFPVSKTKIRYTSNKHYPKCVFTREALFHLSPRLRWS